MTRLPSDDAFIRYHGGMSNQGVREVAFMDGGFEKLMVLLQQALWALEETQDPFLNSFITALEEAIRFSPGIDVRVVRRNQTHTLYPGGARELDKALVEETLEWLDGYPDVAKKFESALRTILSKDSKKFRGVLDDLRLATELFLKAVLRNDKPIEKQKAPLCQWLNSKGIHDDIVKMYSTLLDQFAHYQNRAVKHDEEWKPIEIEFMVYLTGAFIRLVVQLED